MKEESTYQHLPSQEELETFLRSSQAEASSNVVAHAAEQHALVAEALEGYATDPGAIAAVPPVSEVSVLFAAKFGTAAAHVAWIWKVTAWVVLVATGGVITYVATSPSKNTEQKATAEYQTESPDQLLFTEVPTHDSVLIHEEVPPASTKLIVSQDSIALDWRPVQDAQVPSGPASSELQAIPVRTLPTNALIPEIMQSSNLVAVVNKANASAVGLTAVIVSRMEGLRYADYSPLRKAKWSIAANDSSATYTEVMREAIQRYQRQEYKGCIQLLSTIFADYPNDVNVQLYTGMSLFHSGDYYNAERWLGFATTNKISSFKEQALFFRAKALRQMGRKDEAIELFKKVAAMTGEYSGDAYTEMYRKD